MRAVPLRYLEGNLIIFSRYFYLAAVLFLTQLQEKINRANLLSSFFIILFLRAAVSFRYIFRLLL